MTDITNILMGMILLVIGIMGTFVVPLLRQKLGDARVDELARWVRIGVLAAEQIYGDGDGYLKKEYVLNFLATRGYTVDLDKIDAMIEAEVLQLSGAK